MSGVEEEGGVAGGCLDRVVDGEFHRGEEGVPVSVAERRCRVA
jgi:hypothetical protein